MSRNKELDSLKAKEQESFHQKQAAYQRYAEAKRLADSAYINMQSAWNDRCSAREVMNSEYEAMQGLAQLIVRFGLNTLEFVIVILHGFSSFAPMLIMSIE